MIIHYIDSAGVLVPLEVWTDGFTDHLETCELMLPPQPVQSIPMATCSNKDDFYTMQPGNK